MQDESLGALHPVFQAPEPLHFLVIGVKLVRTLAHVREATLPGAGPRLPRQTWRRVLPRQDLDDGDERPRPIFSPNGQPRSGQHDLEQWLEQSPMERT